MGVKSNAMLTVIETQNEIIMNLLSMLELEKERIAIMQPMVKIPEHDEHVYKESIELIDKSIAKKAIKARKLIESIKDNEELMNSL